MDNKQRRSAKRQMMVLMQMGRGFREAANIARVQTSRSTAYRWFQAFRQGFRPLDVFAHLE